MSETGKWTGAAVLALAALVTSPPGARGQAPAPGVEAGAAVQFEFYRFSSPVPYRARSVTMLTLPFAMRASLLPWVSGQVSGAVARGAVSIEGGSTATLAALTDIEARVTAAVTAAGTSLAVSAIGLAPTGHPRLDLPETIVAGMVASNILPFRISNWGAGGGAALDISAVRPVAWGSVGMAVSYRLTSSFRPFDAFEVKYRPGNELSVRLAADRQLANGSTAALQLGYSHFGEDQWAGVGLLRSGQRLLALGSYAIPVGAGTVAAQVGVVHRSGGALGESSWLSSMLSGLLAPPSETLVLLGSSARLPWQDRLLLPAVELRLLNHGDGSGREILIGLGGSAELPIGQTSTRLVPDLRLRLGRVLLAKEQYSMVQGVEVGIGVRFGGSD